MKTICISASMRYRQQIKELMNSFLYLGFFPLFPQIDVSEKDEDSAQNVKEKIAFARAHFEALEKSDILYVFCPDKHIGESVTLEIGYALALKKPIIFSHLTNNPTFDGYPLMCIPPERLAELKQKL